MGIVYDAATGTIAIAGLDSRHQSVTVETLALTPPTPDELQLFWGRGLPQRDSDPELGMLEQAISRLFPDICTNNVLIAVPTAPGDPDFPEEVRPPCAILGQDSPLLKTFCSLAIAGEIVFVSTVLDPDASGDRFALRSVPESGREERPLPPSPLFVRHDLLMACTALITGAAPSPQRAAGVAALIAAWPSAYVYWSSFGRVFSSGDIIQTMRLGQSRTYVISGTETFSVRWNPTRNAEIVDEVALEHALAMSRHGYLREVDALKIALVSLSKTLGITVGCSSTRADSQKSPYTEVWPPREPFIWAMDLVCRL